MAKRSGYPALAVMFLMLAGGIPFANPEDSRAPDTLTTFSDGSAEANLTFPDGGGWDNSTSVTLPANIKVTGANVTLEPGAVTRSGSFAANASELAVSGQMDNLTLRGGNLTLSDGQYWWGQNLSTGFNESEMDRMYFRPTKGITLEKNYNSQAILTYLPEFTITRQKDAIQPKIVMDTEGRSFIVWPDARTGYYDLYAKIITSSGTQFGPEIVVCDAAYNQETPAIAINPSNVIFIAWTDARAPNGDIYGRIYQSNGSPVCPEFVICDASGQQINPAVAAGPNGNFIVAWQDNRDGQGHDIYAKRYTPAGNLNGTEIAVSTMASTQANPDIAVDSNNNFVVTWDNSGFGNPTGIYARRYRENGTPYAAEFTVRYAQGDRLYPTIAFNSSDNFTIAWSDSENPASDIYARRYDSEANPIGDYFIVVSEQNLQIRPQLAVNSRDNWILLWNDLRNASQHHYVKRFDPTWSPIGLEAIVSSVYSAQYEPEFSLDPNNDEFLIVWSDYRNGKPDIYAQRMGDPYQPSGIVLSPPIDFSGSVLLNLTTPSDTGYSMSVIDAATNATLQSMVRHGDFATAPMNEKIRLRIVLSTDNGIKSPTLSEWGVGTRLIDVMDGRVDGTFNNTTIDNGLRLHTIKYENWTQLSSSTTSYGHSAVWDPVNKRMLVFGGYSISGLTNSLQYYWPANDTWALIPVSRISARYQHTAVWDDQNNRMLVLAGFAGGGAVYNDLWSYDPINNSWQHISDVPVERGYHMAAWDSTTKQMFVFGGRNSGGSHLDDLWTYSPSTQSWAKKATGPSARIRGSLIYDPVDDILVLYGGYTVDYSNDTWIYYISNNTWIQKKNGPDTKYGHTAIWDPLEDRMLVYAGNDRTSLYDLWAYDPGKDNWSRLSDGGTGRLFHTAVWDTSNNQMLVYAGDGAGQGMLSDLWSYRYADNAWLQKSRPGFSLALCAAAWDPDQNQMLLFGGQTNNANFPSDLWAYKPLTDSWEKKASGPTGRVWPTMVWDSDNRQMLVFGGADATKSYNDLWAYNPASDQWTQKTSADYTRSRHCAVYDPDNHQMIVFGGYRDSSPLYETVVYSPATDKWTNKADAPEFRYVTSAAWDPDNHQMLVFGGDGTYGRTSNILAYSPSQNRWQSIDTKIPGRIGHVCVWDTKNHRMLVFGGYTDKIQNDLWSFSLETMTSTYICRGATPRYMHAMAWDSTENHLIIFGGGASNYLEDLWSYGYSFADNGSLISTPQDLGNPASIGPISWELDWPKSCYVGIAIRTSPTNQDWSAWENISNGFPPKTTPVDRYIQYRIDMSTVHDPMTPTVFSVTMNYTLSTDSGGLVSSFNSTGNNITDATCQLNASLNGGNITVLLSSDNGASWLPAPVNQSVHFPEPSDTIQYRIQMNASPDGQSPVLQSISIRYDCPSVPSDITIVSGNCSVKVRAFQQETLADIKDLFGDWTNNTTTQPELVTLSVYSATAGTLHLSGLNITYETVPVTPENHPPVISNPSPPDNSTVNSTDIILDWTTTDPDNDTLTFEILLNGSSLGWDLNRPYQLTSLSRGTSYTWQIRANDTHQTVDGPVWRFTVSETPGTNTPPTVEQTSPPDKSYLNSDDGIMMLRWSGSDADGDVLAYTVYLDEYNATTARATTPATNMTFVGNNNGTIYYWKIMASDGKSITSTPVWSFTLTRGQNHPPVFTTTTLPNATVGKLYEFRLLAADQDAETDLYFMLLDGTAHLSMDPEGTIRWYPQQAGIFSFTARVSDGEANDTKTFNITVNAAPRPPVKTDVFPWFWILLLIIIIASVAAYLALRRRKPAPSGGPPEASPSETGPSGPGNLSLIKETQDILAQLQTELAAPSDVLKLKQAEDLLADTSNPQSLQQAHAILTGLVASLKDTAGASESKVEFLSEVEFYAGYVRLKAAMMNRSDTVVTDARFKLIYDTKSLRLSKMEPEYPVEAGDVVLGNLNPGDKKAAAFYLDPLICTESALNGLASFKDSRGNLKALTMKPKKAAVVCPIFHTEEQINVAMLKRMTEGELTRQDRKAFTIPKGTSPEGAFELGKAVVSAHDVRLIREFTEKAPYTAEAWYYGKTKPAGRSIIMRVRVLEDLNILEFFVACDDKRLLTGLLAELAHNLVTRQQAQKAIQSPEPISNEDVLDRLIKVKPLLSKFSDSEAPVGEIEPEPARPASAPRTPPIQPGPPIAPVRPRPEPVPTPRPPAGAIPAGATTIPNPFRDETMALKTLSNIPRGLPGSLSGRSMDELAEELVLAQFAETEDGDTIVKLGKKWYFGDPKQADTYLQPYKI